MTAQYLRGNNMACPLCQYGLVLGLRAKYETLGEHVSNPNRDVPSKQGYRCVNAFCIAARAGYHWLEDGEGPYGGRDLGFDLPPQQLNWNEGIYFPRGTWRYKQETERLREEHSRRYFLLGQTLITVQGYCFDVRISRGGIRVWSLRGWWARHVKYRKEYRRITSSPLSDN